MGEQNTIFDKLYMNASRTPNKVVLADYNGEISYCNFIKKIECIAGFLKEKGVKKGDIVCIKAYQEVSYVACFFGILRAGGVACPVEKSATGERIKTVINSVKAAFYIDKEHLDSVSIKSFLQKDLLSYAEPIDTNISEILSDDFAEIIFTTGTTGASKGILINHSTNIAISENVIDGVESTSDEVEFITSPLSHSLAIRRVYAAIYIGSTIVLSDNILLYDAFWRLIDQYRVTALTIVPASLNLILKMYKDKLGEYNNQFNYVQLGSAPLTEELKNRLRELLPSVRLYNTYGSTESGATIILEFSKYPDKKNCLGRLTVNSRLFFVDDDRTTIVDAKDEKTAGYMAFAGNMNMSGYIHDEELTKTVLRDNIIYTNDIGYIGEDGLVYLIGRAGEVINYGGLKINPAEIEEIAKKIKGIKDCVCVPISDKLVGQKPKLFVVYENEKISDITILEYIRAKLEDYKVPAEIEEINEVPRMFSGKIKRSALMK